MIYPGANPPIFLCSLMTRTFMIPSFYFQINIALALFRNKKGCTVIDTS